MRPSDIVAASDEDTLAGLILDGHGEMPGQVGLLTEQEVNDLIALLRNWQTGETAAEEGQEAEGGSDQAIQFLYLQHCATCHGLSGEGKDDRPPLIDNEFIQSSDDQTIVDVIANGRADTPMEGFAAELTEEEMMTLIELLRSWQ